MEESPMQLKTTLSLALAFALAMGSGAAFAQDMSKSGKPLTAQQEKMKSCSTEAKAKSLKGAERKTFMSTCLKGDSGATAPAMTPAAHSGMAGHGTMSQQDKMKSCNADAKAKS